MKTVLERLAWYYATKAFDPTGTVLSATLNRIVEAVRLAPTSNGCSRSI